MKKSRRLFIAVDFPEKVKGEIVHSIEFLRKQFPQVSWTKKENIHLTIKFLGHIKNNLVEEIKRGIEDSIEGIKPFELSFDEVGYFTREQLIIWQGAETTTYLKLLIKRLDGEMEKIGFRKERREFTPHITVGRGKRLEADILAKIKKEIVSAKFILPKSFQVSQITLIESNLSPKGPIYTPISKFALG